jgi:outer membrane lipoprotein SlyB
MKKHLIVLVLIAISVIGCTKAWTDKAGNVYTEEQKQTLPAEQQADLEKVTVIDPAVASKVETAGSGAVVLATATESIFPAVSGIGNILLAALAIFKTASAFKLKDKLSAITQGALITAESVEKVIKPSTELWDKFRTSQKEGERTAKSNGGSVVMPDKI